MKMEVKVEVEVKVRSGVDVCLKGKTFVGINVGRLRL